MSNEYKDWMWENRQDALRVIALLEAAIETLADSSMYQESMLEIQSARNRLQDEITDS